MNLSELRFLVVDDYPDLRRTMVMNLTDLGYTRVDTAKDGQEALEILQSSHYDFVLTDLRMPRLDGFGLLRAIKADPVLKRLPVIVMSANDPHQFAEPSERLGAAGYLTKPVMKPELQKAIQKALTGLGHPTG